MANPAQTCTKCGQTFSPAQMEMTENGLRCFRCSQTAAIAQHERNRAEAIRSHNKTVVAFNIFRFWELEFHCSECNTELDDGQAFFSISRPPARIVCEKCGATYAPSFWNRARWCWGSILKLGFPIVVAIRYQSLKAAIATGSSEVLFQLFISYVIAFGAAVVLAIPAAFATGGKQPAPR
jgi:recombinational DNA repair protein (RecF pathway)